MAKKILVIAGSPRKGGNSDILCDAFIRGAVEVGNTAEKIYVHDLSIAPCRACSACRKTGVCVQNDDMGTVISKMLEADVIVLASPMYYYSISAQLKLVIDRTYSSFIEMKGKTFYFIVTSAVAGEAMERAFDPMHGFVQCVPGATVAGKVYGGGHYDKGSAKGSAAEDEAYDMGKSIA